jgi:hypothetical protein
MTRITPDRSRCSKTLGRDRDFSPLAPSVGGHLLKHGSRWRPVAEFQTLAAEAFWYCLTWHENGPFSARPGKPLSSPEAVELSIGQRLLALFATLLVFSRRDPSLHEVQTLNCAKARSQRGAKRRASSATSRAVTAPVNTSIV